jgi:hypothetical protein
MPATIYFSGSISGGRADLAHYRRIVEALEADGHRVIAGAVTAADVGSEGESLAPAAIFDRDLSGVAGSHVVVAEVSTPSIGVGYEIAAARYRYGIPVICLYRPAYTRRCSAMVAGDRGIETIEYTDEAFPAMLDRLRTALSRIGE